MSTKFEYGTRMATFTALFGLSIAIGFLSQAADHHATVEAHSRQDEEAFVDVRSDVSARALQSNTDLEEFWLDAWARPLISSTAPVLLPTNQTDSWAVVLYELGEEEAVGIGLYHEEVRDAIFVDEVVHAGEESATIDIYLSAGVITGTEGVASPIFGFIVEYEISQYTSSVGYRIFVPEDVASDVQDALDQVIIRKKCSTCLEKVRAGTLLCTILALPALGACAVCTATIAACAVGTLPACLEALHACTVCPAASGLVPRHYEP